MLYRNFSNEGERIIAVMEHGIDLEIKSLQADLLACESVLDRNIAAAELKVITESGSFEDALTLFEAANEEAKEQNGGLISKTIARIKQWLKSAKEKIMGLFAKNSEAPVDKGNEQAVSQEANIFKRAMSRFTSLIPKIKAGQDCGAEIDGIVDEYKSNYNKIKMVGLGVAGTLTTSALFNKFWNGEAVEGMIDRIDAAQKGGIKGKAEQLWAKLLAGMNTVAGLNSKFVQNAIMRPLAKGKQVASNVAGAAKKKLGKDGKEEAGEVKNPEAGSKLTDDDKKNMQHQEDGATGESTLDLLGLGDLDFEL